MYEKVPSPIQQPRPGLYSLSEWGSDEGFDRFEDEYDKTGKFSSGRVEAEDAQWRRWQ
jgi:hypothetical protein